VGAAQGIFLPKMGAITGDLGPNSGVAGSGLVVTIHTTLAATEIALVQALISGFHTPLQLACAM
jgi:hypothetical protein